MTTAVQQLVRRNNLPFCTDLSDCKTIEEGIEKAGLNFQVSLRPLYTDNGLNIGKCATVREDKQTVLGIVSPKYNILQNIEAFKFFDEYLENGLATLETAGTLKGGVKTFILAKITGEDMYITPEDRVEKYILLSNSHDGSSTVRIGFTPIRVVCCNMLSRVHKDTSSQFMRIYHKSDVANTLTEIKATMDLVNQQFIATEEQYKQLAQMDVNQSDLRKYLKVLFSTQKLENIVKEHEQEVTEKEEIENTRKRLIARVEEIFELEPVKNRWTMYNSVNYYLNHERGKDADNRYNSLMFEDSGRLDRRALELAYQL